MATTKDPSRSGRVEAIRRAGRRRLTAWASGWSIHTYAAAQHSPAPSCSRISLEAEIREPRAGRSRQSARLCDNMQFGEKFGENNGGSGSLQCYTKNSSSSCIRVKGLPRECSIPALRPRRRVARASSRLRTCRGRERYPLAAMASPARHNIIRKSRLPGPRASMAGVVECLPYRPREAGQRRLAWSLPYA